ncbi:MAG: DUF4870 domain-containing protein [Actinomycetota bacterium]
MSDMPPAPPGWYPVDGVQRYWDGTAWTDHIAPAAVAPGENSDDKTLALLAHILTLVVGFLAPLVIFLMKKDESPYVRHHAAEALNFQISVMIYAFVSLILILVLIGILMIMALAITALVLTIIATVKASQGEYYRYPLTIRLVK